MSVARPITVADLEYFYAGLYQHPFVLPSDIYDLMEVQKALGTIETTTAGVLNRVFGAMVWTQMNLEANWFGMLPKTTWVRSGWRVWKQFAETNTSNLAVSETGTLPSPVQPEIQMVYDSPKIMVETFEVSDVLEALATTTNDDVWGASVQARLLIGTEFHRHINRALGSKVAEAPSAWTLPEKVDRIVSKHNEQGFTPGWANVHGIDRSLPANAWANSYVNDAASPRALTYNLLLDLWTQTRKRGANITAFMTGYETFAAIASLAMTFVRYLPMSETMASFGVNGIQTGEGLQFGVRVASILGVPIVQSQDVAVGSAAGELPYIYALDMSDMEGYGLPRLAMSVLRPVEYFETREFILLNKFVIKGAFRFIGQTVGRFLYGQGKLRDITT